MVIEMEMFMFLESLLALLMEMLMLSSDLGRVRVRGGPAGLAVLPGAVGLGPGQQGGQVSQAHLPLHQGV